MAQKVINAYIYNEKQILLLYKVLNIVFKKIIIIKGFRSIKKINNIKKRLEFLQ